MLTGFRSRGISAISDKSVNIWATSVLATYTYICPYTHIRVFICFLSSFSITDLNVSSMRAESSPVEHQLLARCLADNRYSINIFQVNEQMWAFFVHKTDSNNPCLTGLLLGMKETTERAPCFLHGVGGGSRAAILGVDTRGQHRTKSLGHT